ncbi:MAG: hypothetical protein J1F22_00855 [Lachnospiraceae bacterium]|nr:hypothetical protein [Lachnospiraceae bacterium]
MTFNYARIQGREISYATGNPKGIFALCWRMIYDGQMEKGDEERFREIDDWFKEYLPEPGPCQRNEAVITYFKTETTKDMLEKLKPVMCLLEKYKKPYDLIYTNFVGEIIYEDKWQVAVRAGKGKENL